MNLLSIKPFLIGLLIGAVLAFPLGWYTKSKFIQAAQVEQSQKVIKGTANSIIESIDKSRGLESKIQQAGKVTDDIKEVAVARAVERSKKEKRNESVPSCGIPELPTTIDTNEMRPVRAFDTDGHLDVGTVRLLNAASEGRALESVSLSDAESKAPSEVTGEALLRDAFETRKLYNELSARHDELVTEVEEKLRKQAQ